MTQSGAPRLHRHDCAAIIEDKSGGFSVTMRRILFAIASLFLLPTALLAQGWGSIDLSIPMSNTGFILSQQIVTMTAPKAPFDGDKSDDAVPQSKRPVPRATGSSSLAVPVATSNSAAKLAMHYPVARRDDAERLFKQLLAAHGRLMQQFGVPQNDMASAVATFIAGSHAAYHDQLIEEAAFVALVDQMRVSLADNPALASATSAERRDAYEQLVILGMMTATTQMALSQNPDPGELQALRANMREAGRTYLRGYVGVDPDAIELGPRGMTLAR
jgi:hypothetical protein